MKREVDVKKSRLVGDHWTLVWMKFSCEGHRISLIKAYQKLKHLSPKLWGWKNCLNFSFFHWHILVFHAKFWGGSCLIANIKQKHRMNKVGDRKTTCDKQGHRKKTKAWLLNEKGFHQEKIEVNEFNDPLLDFLGSGSLDQGLLVWTSKWQPWWV